MAKMSTSIVFLSDAESREDRIFETAGVSPGRASSDVWFEDGRTNPKHTATYLKRLGFLRKELYHQEKDNRLEAVRRLQDGPEAQKGRGNNKKYQKVKKHNPKQGFPERHKKLQQQRKFELERHRNGAPDTSGNLQPLHGERVSLPASIQSDPPVSPVGHGAFPDMSDNLQQLIELQRQRIAQAKGSIIQSCLSPSPTSVASSISPQSSIPNLERKTFKAPEKLLPIDHADYKRSESFVRQKALHHKDSKGIYRGQHRNLLRADMDEIDLHPENVRFEIPADTNHSVTPSGQSFDKYSAPLSTPIHWEDNDVTSKTKLNKNKNKNNVASKGSSQASKPSQKASPHQIQGVKEPHRDQGYMTGFPGNPDLNPSLLRTTTSLYAPTWQGYVRVAKRNPMPNVGHQEQAQKQTNSHISSGVNEASSFSSHQDIPQRASRPEDDPDRSQVDLVYGYPQTVPMQAENGDIIFVNPSNTDLEYYPKDLTEIQHDANFTSPQSSLPSTPTDRKVNLVVDIPQPDIVLNPPSPHNMSLDKQAEEQTSTVSLRKTFRQNELREKEVSDLLDDVKELNKVTESVVAKAEATENEAKT